MITQAEYDRSKNQPTIVVGPQAVGSQAVVPQEPILVDGQSVAPLRLTIINDTAEDLYQAEQSSLRGTITVVGVTSEGVKLVRRSGGADYGGRDQWRRLMARCGRLQD